jgi:hypothetical protein
VNADAPAESTYAYSLYPERESEESQSEWTVKLGPELKFASGVEVGVGELGATFTHRRAYPVIQAYDVGTPRPYWVYRPHTARPLDGSQFVYAVIAARAGSGGVRAVVDLTVSVRSAWGLRRFRPPEEARAQLSFTIP